MEPSRWSPFRRLSFQRLKFGARSDKCIRVLNTSSVKNCLWHHSSATPWKQIEALLVGSAKKHTLLAPNKADSCCNQPIRSKIHCRSARWNPQDPFFVTLPSEIRNSVQVFVRSGGCIESKGVLQISAQWRFLRKKFLLKGTSRSLLGPCHPNQAPPTPWLLQGLQNVSSYGCNLRVSALARCSVISIQIIWPSAAWWLYTCHKPANSIFSQHIPAHDCRILQAASTYLAFCSDVAALRL